MRYLAGIMSLLFVAAPAVAATPAPPPDIVKATQQLFIDAQPQPEPGDDPADYPPPLPGMPDAKTVRGWLKDGVLRPIKVTPGPSSDWLIDTGRMETGGAWYCGTGGCVTQIWTGYPGHYVKIFDQQVREYRFHWIGKRSGYTWMDADFHGSLCGKTGVEACPWGFEWRSDGRAYYGLFATWRFAHGEVIHPGPPPQAVDPMLDPAGSGVPQVIRDAVAKNDAACKAWGADNYATEGMANRLPDLNGDGVDDWSYDGAMGSCNFDEPNPDLQDVSDAPAEHEHANDDPCTVLNCETVIWLSRRDGADVAWDRLALERGYALRYKGGKVDLVQLDNPPGVTDDDPAACDTYNIGNCVLTPIPLSPKP